MANFRSLSFTVEVHANDAEQAHRRVMRMIKKTGIRKVHAVQMISIRPKTYLCDIIIKESIQKYTPRIDRKRSRYQERNTHGISIYSEDFAL